MSEGSCPKPEMLVIKTLGFVQRGGDGRVASYADILWDRHVIFLSHEHPGMNVCRSQGNISCPLFARILIKAADFAPEIDWRSRENYFSANRRGLYT